MVNSVCLCMVYAYGRGDLIKRIGSFCPYQKFDIFDQKSFRFSYLHRSCLNVQKKKKNEKDSVCRLHFNRAAHSGVEKCSPILVYSASVMLKSENTADAGGIPPPRTVSLPFGNGYSYPRQSYPHSALSSYLSPC